MKNDKEIISLYFRESKIAIEYFDEIVSNEEEERKRINFFNKEHIRAKYKAKYNDYRSTLMSYWFNIYSSEDEAMYATGDMELLKNGRTRVADSNIKMLAEQLFLTAYILAVAKCGMLEKPPVKAAEQIYNLMIPHRKELQDGLESWA